MKDFPMTVRKCNGVAVLYRHTHRSFTGSAELLDMEPILLVRSTTSLPFKRNNKCPSIVGRLLLSGVPETVNIPCHTHTPGHSSAADEAWYWLKCILRNQ